METNLNIEAKDGELTIRHGNAPEIHEKVILIHDGVLSAPGDYYKQRIERLNSLITTKSEETPAPFSNCVVIVDTESGSIELIENQSDHFATKIKGSLKPFPPFAAFGINQDKKRNLRAMALFIKKNKVFFKDESKAEEVFMSLLSQKAKITKDIESADDLRGNIKKYFETKLEGVKPIKFELNIPLFKGDVKRTFEVEIILDVVNEEIQAYLESSSLFEINYNLKEDLLDLQIKRFDGEAILKK